MISNKAKKTVSILTLLMIIFNQAGNAATAPSELAYEHNQRPGISVDQIAPSEPVGIPSGAIEETFPLSAPEEEPVVIAAARSILMQNGQTFNHKISDATGWIKEGEAVTNYKNVSILSGNETASGTGAEMIGKYQADNETYSIWGVNTLKKQQQAESPEVTRLKPEILARLVISTGLSMNQLEGLIESMVLTSPGKLTVQFKEGQMPAGRLVDSTGSARMPSKAEFEIWNSLNPDGSLHQRVPGIAVWSWGAADPTALVVFSGADPEKLAVVSWRDASLNEIYQDNYIYKTNGIEVQRVRQDVFRVWHLVFKILLPLPPAPNPTPANADDEDGAKIEFTYDEQGKLVKAVKTVSSGPWGSADKTVFDFTTMKAVKTFANGIEITYDFQVQHNKTLEPGESLLASWITHPATGAYLALTGVVHSAFYNMRYSVSLLDGTLEYREKKVPFNPGQDHGQVPNGNALSSWYDFHKIQGIDGAEYSVLVLADGNAPGMAIFLLDAARSRYELLSFTQNLNYNDILSRSRVDVEEPFWKVIPKFLNDPTSLNSDEFRALTAHAKDDSFINEKLFFRASFMPLYIHRLLDALSQKDKFVFEPAADFFSGVFDIAYEIDVTPGEKQKIIEHLELVWDSLSLQVKDVMLGTLKTGNEATANKLGELFLRYVDEVVALYPEEYQRGAYLPGKSRATIHSLLGNIGLDKEIRSKILRAAFQDMRNYQGGAFLMGIINDYIIKLDGITVDAEDYAADIAEALHRKLPEYPASYLRLAFGDLLQYVQPQDYHFLEDAAAEWIARFSAQSTTKPDSLTELLIMLSWPISEASKNEIRNQLNRLNVEDWGINEINSFAGGYGMKPLPLTPELRGSFFMQLAEVLAAAAPSRDMLQDGFSGHFDSALKNYIHLLKQQENDFELYADSLTPLLAQFNPKQAAETDAQYALRLAAIESLWIDGRIFLYDTRGGSFTTPGYLDAFADFARTHKDWVEIAVLAVTEHGEAGPGWVQFNWVSSYPTPYRLAFSLQHEGGHSMHLKLEANSRVFNSLVQYWQYEFTDFNPLNYVSAYSRTNDLEYAAEVLRFWYADGRSWLTEALKRYKDGHPNVLNMLLAAWNLDVPEGTPAGMMPLFLLNTETARLETEYLKVSWESGDMRNGIFKFELDGKEYRIQYSDYLITSVLEGPIVEAPAVESNLKTLLDGRIFTHLADKTGSLREGNVQDYFEEVEQAEHVAGQPEVLPEGAVTIGYFKDAQGKVYLLHGKPTVREITLEDGRVMTIDLRTSAAPAPVAKVLAHTPVKKASLFLGGETSSFFSSSSRISESESEQEKKKRKKKFRRAVTK